MIKNTRILFVFAVLLIVNNNLLSQNLSWQWIKTGGSQSANSLEYPRDLRNDSYGNIYSASMLYGLNSTINGVPKQSYGGSDFCVFSYNCDGSFRWAKYFGSSFDDDVHGICVSPKGSVYVLGEATNNYFTFHYGDSVINSLASVNKQYFITKMDTSGNVDYISFFLSNNYPLVGDIAEFMKMEWDAQGDLSVFVGVPDSVTLQGFILPHKGYYILKINPETGVIKKVIDLDMNVDNYLRWDDNQVFYTFDNNNNIYFQASIQNNLIVGNDTLSSSNVHNVLIKFDSLGNLAWYKKAVFNSIYYDYTTFIGKPFVSGDYVYIAGTTFASPSGSFCGLQVINSANSISAASTSVYARFNKNNGSIFSLINLHSAYDLNTVMTLKNNKIIIAGTSYGLVKLNSFDTLVKGNMPVTNYNLIAIELDTSLTSFSHWSYTPTTTAAYPILPTSLLTDYYNNIYFGGATKIPIINSAGDTISPDHSDLDFFVIKIADSSYSCGCAASTPNLQIVSFSSNNLTISGSAKNNPDSLFVIWGDGDSTIYSSMNTNISHVYSTAGPWNVCLKSYGFCGIEEICISNLYSDIIQPTINNNTLSVFPNPCRKEIHIEFLERSDGKLFIFDMMGKEVLIQEYHTKHTVVPISKLSKGVYLLKIITDQNEIMQCKIIKE